MPKVRTFSKYFPSTHIKKGQPTFFAEKILISFIELGIISVSKAAEIGKEINSDLITCVNDLRKLDLKPKHHTVRSGEHFKSGDTFSPRIWSGRPYASKQITLLDEVEIKKVFKFEMDLCGVYSVDGFYTDLGTDELIAENDGLTEMDFFNWFMPNYQKPVEFSGQIICWNPSIEYNTI